jgi:transposase-like protein
VVRAYASGDESHTVVARRFSLNPWTLLRWILVRAARRSRFRDGCRRN